jgi:long-chain acyl-CoA synthetase
MTEPQDLNRASHLLRQADRDGDRIAIEYCGAETSFAELARQVRATAGALRELGVGKGSRVGMMIPTSPDFIVTQQAIHLLGAAFSSLNIAYRPGELAHVIESCELEFLVIHADYKDRVPPSALNGEGTLRSVILAGTSGEHPGHALLDVVRSTAAPASHPEPLGPEDVAMLLNTSATTGKSKGVMLTAANLAANYDATPGWLGLDGSDVILCALPLYNTFGLNQCINAMAVTGARLVLLPRFDPQACIEAIQRSGCTFMPAVPTMLQKIVDHPGLEPGGLHTLRRIMTGGATVPAALLQRVLRATSPDAKVLTGYGLTEATALVTLCQVTCDASGDLEHGRTIGKVLDGMELAVMDDADRLLPAGETGELVMRGPNVMAGYYNAPQDTVEALREGWLHSGDIGYIDEQGYAFIVDRKKDVIIRGGQNIYPADIEEVIYGIDGVAEVAVIAQHDDILGEVPIAFVALRPGAQVSEAAIRAQCEAFLASYKLPRAIHFLEELPKGPTGKILRRALRDRATAAA